MQTSVRTSYHPSAASRPACGMSGASQQQAHFAVAQPVPVNYLMDDMTDARMEPWIEAAEHFQMNVDFDLSLPQDAPSLPEMMSIMKVQSKGKCTIQALGDKILLHRMLNNLGLPQMPILLGMHGTVDRNQVEQLVDSLERSGQEDAFDIVAKPTHLSNGTGSLILSSARWRWEEYTADDLALHMEENIQKQAHETESVALQSLVPGFLVQPLYTSTVDFGFPIEIRVITLWGKTRVGVWWFGGAPEDLERNTWFVPVLKPNGEVEKWHALTARPNWSPSAKHQAGIQLILQAMPTLASSAEQIATATGAPYLRSDFFVGSPKWGIRLNEVAYCSNIELRRMASNQMGFADDQGAIARILHTGFKRCQRRPADGFLAGLGARGVSYEPAWWSFWSHAPGLEISQLPLAANSASQNISGPPRSARREKRSNAAMKQHHPTTSMPSARGAATPKMPMTMMNGKAAPAHPSGAMTPMAMAPAPPPARAMEYNELYDDAEESGFVESARRFVQSFAAGTFFERQTESDTPVAPASRPMPGSLQQASPHTSAQRMQQHGPSNVPFKAPPMSVSMAPAPRPLHSSNPQVYRSFRTSVR